MKILPCPFCGRKYKGKIITMQGRAEKFECPGCGAEGPFPRTKSGVKQRENMPQDYYDELTLESWNRRVDKSR